MRLFELAGLVAGRNRLRARALPVMNALAAELASAVSLAVLDHLEVVYLDNIAPDGVALPVRLRRMPAHCTGLGKAMLAFADEEHVEALVRHGLTAQTPNTIVDPDCLRETLAETRETGVAFDREEAVTGFGCVAAPIRGAGRALAAVSATLPIDQIDVELLAPRLRDAATEIWSSLFNNREGAAPPSSQRQRSAEQATVSSMERAVSAELGQWLKYDDWL
jgi:DNA-binding IclR family transcriptional regulator